MSTPIVMPFVESTEYSFGQNKPVTVVPDPTIEYAQDANVQAQCNDLYNVKVFAELNRQSLEEEWREALRMEMLVFDGNQKYRGRSNIYVPLFIKINQTKVAALTRGLFPSDAYMSVADESEEPDMRKAAAVKALLQREFDYIAGLRKRIKPGLAQLNRTGNTVYKYWYHKNTKKDGRRQIRAKTVTIQDVMNGAPKPARDYDYCAAKNMDGLRFSPRNMFNFYVWPTTAESLDDATVCWENIDVPRQYVDEMLKRGEWKNVDAESALAFTSPTGHLTNQAELHGNGYNLTAPVASPLQNSKLGGVVVISEVWTNMVLPSSAYVGDEEPGTPVPVKIIMSGRTVLSCRRNPLFHQKPPFLLARQNVAPGLIYGYSIGRSVKALQFLANDFMNQTNDVLQYGLNPILKVNVNHLAGPLPPMAPGRVWQMTDIHEGAEFERPPADLGNIGIEAYQMISGMAFDFSGAPPVLQGTSAGKGAKTATGAQILQRNSMSIMQDEIEDLEQDVMIPLMYGTWFLEQQYMEQQVMAQIAGEPMAVKPEDLLINPNMRWLASSQAANQAQRAQQSIQFLQAIMPLLPVLNQQGIVFNPLPFLERVVSDTLGMRDFNSMFKQAAQMPGAMMPAQGGTPDGASQEQGDRVRSALEQIGGGQGDMVAGEGEDFMDIRNQADAIAGAQGG